MHNPQRREGESQQQYRERQAQSRRAVERICAKAGSRPNVIDLRTLGKPASSTDRERARTKAEKPAAPGPKFAKERHRKSRSSYFTDKHGAYTLVGSTYEVAGMAPDTDREHVTSSWVDGPDMGYTARRKWLAGISAQRGY